MVNPSRLVLVRLSALALLLLGCGSTPTPAPPPAAPPAVVAPPPAPPPLAESRYVVPGLEAPAEILIDRWGVPHVVAQRTYDVFVAQGFNAARDRLWQLDLWRRRGEGKLAEALGPDYVEQDRAARLFLFRGDMHAEWLAYGSDTKRIATAFVAGINAYVELTEREPSLRPPEFDLLGYRPGRWQPDTLVRLRSHGLFRNARSEIARARFVRDHGVASLDLRDRFEPDHDLVIPEGLDLDRIPGGDVLRDYRLARSGVAFSAKLAAELRALGSVVPDLQAGLGSNSWVVAPTKTATGRAMLASDPHRRVTVPSLRYLVHLRAPGLNVIGAGEPALPGISIGHNGRIAFGLTVFGIDQEDVYLYETRRGQPDQYRYEDRWEPMRTVYDVIPVRGERQRPVTYHYTRHGPVVFEDPDAQSAIAVRAAWLQPGMAPYLAGLELMRAKGWDQFLAAMNRWNAPAENLMYADVDGNIGWKPGGLAPVRPGWDGLLPVPGDGRYEWQGYLDMDRLPVAANPPSGFLATANQMNLPKGYPEQLGFEWSRPSRFQRIGEVLSRAGKVSVADMVGLQQDVSSLPARRLLRLLATVRSSKIKVAQGLELLRAWDGSLDAGSGAAALFEIWYRRHLGPALAAHLSGNEALRGALARTSPQLWLRLLEAPDGRFGADPRGARDQLMLDSLEQAVDTAEQLLGPDWDAWRWGSLHQAQLDHPLSELLDPSARAHWNVGPVPRGGSADTVCKTSYPSQSYRQLSGASFRMVLDVGAWDQSVAMNSPGQSGDPRSAHYRDLFIPWSTGAAFPLVYSPGAIRQAAERRIVLQPATR